MTIRRISPVLKKRGKWLRRKWRIQKHSSSLKSTRRARSRLNSLFPRRSRKWPTASTNRYWNHSMAKATPISSTSPSKRIQATSSQRSRLTQHQPSPTTESLSHTSMIRCNTCHKHLSCHWTQRSSFRHPRNNLLNLCPYQYHSFNLNLNPSHNPSQSIRSYFSYLCSFNISLFLHSSNNFLC